MSKDREKEDQYNNNQNQPNQFGIVDINEQCYNSSLNLGGNSVIRINNNASLSGVIDVTNGAASQDFIFIEEGGVLKAGTKINSGASAGIFTLENDINGPITICLGSQREIILDSFSNHTEQLSFEINNNQNNNLNVNFFFMEKGAQLTINTNSTFYATTIDAKAVDINSKIVTINEGGILKAGTKIVSGDFKEFEIVEDIYGPATISVGEQRQIVINYDNLLNDIANNIIINNDIINNVIIYEANNDNEKENMGASNDNNESPN